MEWQFPAPAIDEQSDHPKVARPDERLRVKTKEQEKVNEQQRQGEFEGTPDQRF